MKKKNLSSNETTFKTYIEICACVVLLIFQIQLIPHGNFWQINSVGGVKSAWPHRCATFWLNLLELLVNGALLLFRMK